MSSSSTKKKFWKPSTISLKSHLCNFFKKIKIISLVVTTKFIFWENRVTDSTKIWSLLCWNCHAFVRWTSNLRTTIKFKGNLSVMNICYSFIFNIYEYYKKRVAFCFSLKHVQIYLEEYLRACLHKLGCFWAENIVWKHQNFFFFSLTYFDDSTTQFFLYLIQQFLPSLNI